jgi:hypothetical protein
MPKAKFGRAGRIYDTFRGRDLYEYPCDILGQHGEPRQCCHFDCRLRAIRLLGKCEVADKLDANATAQDWARNWGKLVYEKNDGWRGRKAQDRQRREAMAKIIRGMRTRSMGFAEACVTGTWAGALMEPATRPQEADR